MKKDKGVFVCPICDELSIQFEWGDGQSEREAEEQFTEHMDSHSIEEAVAYLYDQVYKRKVR